MRPEEAIQAKEQPPNVPLLAGYLCGIIIPLLVVGIVSGTLLRHVIQLIPVALALVLTVRKTVWGPSAALPLMFFWLVLMVIIWLFLLGVTTIMTGHFTPVEIAMTIIIGASCTGGVITSLRHPGKGRPGWRILVFIIFLGLQVFVTWISFQRSVAHD